MATAAAAKLASLLNDHGGVIANGTSVLGEVEAAALALEQALFDIDQAPHGSIDECSPDASVQNLETTFCAVMDARRSIEHRQAAIRRLQQRLAQGGIGDLVQEFDTAYAQAVEAAATADAALDAATANRAPPRRNAPARIPKQGYYAHNDDYKNFRQSLWEVRNGETPFGAASAQSRTQCRADGDHEGAGDDMDEDEDDLVVTSQKTTYKCPISLQTMHNPYTSRICSHSFSEAIFESFRRGDNQIRCPVAGCGRRMTRADLKPNQQLKRRIARWLRLHPDGEDDLDQDDVVDIQDE